MHWRVFGCSFYLTSSALNTSGHDRGSSACCVRALTSRTCARQELVTYSCCGQSHLCTRLRTLDTPWMLEVSAVSIGVKLAFTVTPDKFHCSAVSTTFLPYFYEERQVASARICASRCAFRWHEHFPRKCAGQLWITTQSSIDVEISAKVKTYVFPDSSTFTNACASISCFADQFHPEFTMTGRAPLLHQIICPTLHLRTRTAYGVGSINNDLQIATAAETSFSASRRDTDGVMDTRDHLLVTPSPFCWPRSFRVPDEDKEKLQEESCAHHAF